MTKNKALEFRDKLAHALHGGVFAVQLIPPEWVVIWTIGDDGANIISTAAEAAAVLEAKLT